MDTSELTFERDPECCSICLDFAPMKVRRDEGLGSVQIAVTHTVDKMCPICAGYVVKEILGRDEVKAA